MIQIRNLTKTYGQPPQQVEALKGINLEIAQGEIFGIIGLSGAGKSTLIRTLNRMEEPTTGTIQINGEDILSYNSNELTKFRQKVGMIFQHFNLLKSRTVHGNVRFPLEIAKVEKTAMDDRVSEMLELVGLSDKAQAYASQLSGGQKQRVAIARALCNQPDLLLCDEATSALDPKTTAQILELLKQIRDQLGLTIVLITHEMEVIRQICDRVAVIDDGVIVESGKVAQVFNAPEKEITREFLKHMSPVDITVSKIRGGRAC